MIIRIILVLAVACLDLGLGFIAVPPMPLGNRFLTGESMLHSSSSRSSNNNNNRDPFDIQYSPERATLESFFELASRQGSSNVRKMSPETRARYAMIGEELEDSIYEKCVLLREKAEEQLALNGVVDESSLQYLVDDIIELKKNYAMIIGGIGIPPSYGQE